MTIKTPDSLLPNSGTLAARLTAALRGGSFQANRTTIVERKLPAMMSTYPNEVVACRLPDGRTERVFIKYQGDRTHESFGHRGGVAYEAAVYQHLLQPLGNFRPRCLGVHTDRRSKKTWLVLEYIPRTVRVSDIVKGATRQPVALIAAAKWAAEFHAAHESCRNSGKSSFLRRYDAEYYRGWARRMFDFSRPLRKRFPWLARLERRQADWWRPLMGRPLTVIHGEFYAKTLLLQRRRLFIIDWESAAIAAGEIDLAALTEGKHWRGNVAAQCEAAYRRVRWPEGAPEQFEHRLEAAKMYLHFRWLGERPEWATREKTLWRYEHLRASAQRARLI